MRKKLNLVSRCEVTLLLLLKTRKNVPSVSPPRSPLLKRHWFEGLLVQITISVALGRFQEISSEFLLWTYHIILIYILERRQRRRNCVFVECTRKFEAAPVAACCVFNKLLHSSFAIHTYDISAQFVYFACVLQYCLIYISIRNDIRTRNFFHRTLLSQK